MLQTCVSLCFGCFLTVSSRRMVPTVSAANSTPELAEVSAVWRDRKRRGNRGALIFEVLEARVDQHRRLRRCALPLVGADGLIAPLRKQRDAGRGGMRTESIFLLLRQVDQLA